jgi:two-component system sensor histidine kinase KdpD
MYVMHRKTLTGLRGYFIGPILILITTLAGLFIQPFLDPTNIAMLYLLCVVLTTVFWGLGPAILVCFISVLAHDFFFIKPFLSFGPPSVYDIPNLFVLLTIGTIISYLTSRIRKQTEEAQRRELETHTLYVLSRNLAITEELEASIKALMQSARETLGNDVTLFLPDKRNAQLLKPFSPNLGNTGDNGINIATWSFQHQQKAGPGTDMFSQATACYLPLLTARGAVGVISVPVQGNITVPLTGQERLLEAFADLAAVAIERVAFAEEARNMKLSQAATEKLQAAFLDAISHELKTPLSSVIGVLSSLQEDPSLNDAAKANLIGVAREEAEILNDTITKLLDISRIQAGAIKLSRQPADVGDIISVAIDQLGKRSQGREIKVSINHEIAPAMADFSLIVKVLLNLLDNALKYSTADSVVDIKAQMGGDNIAIEVADRGIGIPPQDLPFLFGRFYRVPNTGIPGTGLGLSICKGIVEAHGGVITAGNRAGGGMVFTVTLPAGGPMQRRPVLTHGENKRETIRIDEGTDTSFVG